MNTNFASSGPMQATNDIEPYRIYSRRELIGVLRDVIEHRYPVTVYFNQGDEFIVTQLLSMNPDFEELIFDIGVDQKLNERLATSRRLTLVTFDKDIKVQFSAASVEMINMNELPAFRVRIPESLVRLQRRAFLRVAPPIASPLVCSLPHPDAPDEVKARIRGTVTDISCGGLSMLVPPDGLGAEVGSVFEDCEMSLPGSAPLRFTLEVRQLHEEMQGSKLRAIRLRCKFRVLRDQGEILVQRYINRLERERKDGP